MAIKTGQILFSKLERCGTVPFRFVVWSWHSKGPGSRRGFSNRVRTHADWADAQGYYVANMVSRMSNAYPINLMGFSLGSITASSALHFLGGGQIAGRTIPSTPPTGYYDLRSVHLAGAMDNDLLMPQIEPAVYLLDRIRCQNGHADG